MRIFLAALLAAFLAVPAAYAADRPVGPETGQARTAAAPEGFDHGPDDDGTNFVAGQPQEVGSWAAFMCWTFRWFAGSSNPRGDCARGHL